jgi:hypothetical protein
MGCTPAGLFATAALGAALLAPAARAAGPPLIEATYSEGVTATGATLRAEINPDGAATAYRFEYVSDAAFAQSGFAQATKLPSAGPTGIGPGTASVEVAQHPSGLAPAGLYHYRVTASNSFEAPIGPERSLTTQDPTNAFSLPDARAWELVSPIDKGGGAIQGPGQNFGGDLDQAAAQGNLFTYSAATAFGNAPGAPPASQYLATRTAAGWQSQNVSTPLRAGAYGEEPDGVPYRLFSTDLGKGLLYGGACHAEAPECPATNPPLPGSGAAPGYADYYLRQSTGGGFTALIDQAAVAHSSLGPEAIAVSAVAASPDLSHVVLSSCAALASGAIELSAGPDECDSQEPNLYESSSAGLALLNVLPGDTQGTPGAEVGASLGAISTDGSRVYWTDGANLYLREAGQSLQVDEAQGGGGSFETASSDGSVAFFTKGAHLYRYLADSGVATDLTPSGGIAGVLGASENGASVYFQDASGLWLWREGTLTEVAPGATAALSSDYPPATGTARLDADGAHLAFLSEAELGDYENVGRTEAYLYGPPPGGGDPVLLCASCNPTGERPRGAASIPGAPPNGASATPYKPRVLSAAGSRLFFDSFDRLASQDTSHGPEVYEWQAAGSGGCGRSGGCVRLISSGRSRGGAGFLDASAAGSDVFFLTDASLVGADPGSIDVYDAKVNGGFAEASKPIPCIADACQALPAAPEDPTPGTLVPNSGNPALHVVKERQKGHKGKRHKKRHRHKPHKGGGR